MSFARYVLRETYGKSQKIEAQCSYFLFPISIDEISRLLWLAEGMGDELGKGWQMSCAKESLGKLVGRKVFSFLVSSYTQRQL